MSPYPAALSALASASGHSDIPLPPDSFLVCFFTSFRLLLILYDAFPSALLKITLHFLAPPLLLGALVCFLNTRLGYSEDWLVVEMHPALPGAG